MQSDDTETTESAKEVNQKQITLNGDVFDCVFILIDELLDADFSVEAVESALVCALANIAASATGHEFETIIDYTANLTDVFYEALNEKRKAAELESDNDPTGSTVH